jgi:N-sulfoglucosamine sulfohydrolase
MHSRPNVVLFITHDTGCHVSPYGVKTVRTPNCERLAREGVRFSRSFCTTPLCSPSRAALTTGRYPHQNGVRGLTGNLTGGFALHETERHAAALFREGGYESVLCGFMHEARTVADCGFERAISGTGGDHNYGGDLRNHGREIAAWLAERDSARPFYLQIGCHETHHPFTKFDTPPDESLGLTVPPYLSDIPDVRRELAELQGSIQRMDEGLGRILDALDAARVADDTLFVFTTDHGIDFARAKGTLYDAGLEVFLFMRYPRSQWGRGRVIDGMVSNIDVLPTLLEACGLLVPTNLAGRTLSPVLLGQSETVQDVIYGEKDYHDTYDPTRCARTERYKYIRYFEVNLFHDVRLATMTRRHHFRYPWRREGIEELYDLANDPHETRNLASDPNHAAVLKDMQSRLVGWMRRTDDPLLRQISASPFYARATKALLQACPGKEAASAEASAAKGE